VLLKDGFEYKFPHRSLQEYFTAIFISKLPSNKKSKAYKNVLKILKESSSDYSSTFWNLCQELDEVAFKKNFLIPQLKLMYNKLINKEGEKLIDSYFKLLEPRFLYRKFRDDEEKILRIYRRASFTNSLTDFCEVYNYDDVWNFPTTSKCDKDIIALYPKKSKENVLSKFENKLQSDPKVISILNKNGFLKLVETIREDFNQKIIELEKTIIEEQNNIDELLNI
jgi:hypothetical protein